jgi:hypothetical protein
MFGERRNVYGVLLGKPEGKSPFRRPIVDERILLKWNLRRGMRGTDWIDLAQDSDR